MNILVLNVTSDRVLFFTDDVNFTPSVSEYTWSANYEDPIPIGMTLKNCWNWRLKNGVLEEASGTLPEDLGLSKEEIKLKNNKKVLLTQLNEKIDKISSTFLPESRLDVEIQHLIENQDQQVANDLGDLVIQVKADVDLKKRMIIKAFNMKHEMKEKIKNATTDQQLEFLRRQIFNLSI